MTAETQQTAADVFDEMGPIDFLVVEFPGNHMSGEALPLLADLVDRGLIRILDFVFIRKETDGSVAALSAVDLSRMRLIEATLFEGAASGLLTDVDLHEAATTIEPGSSAGVLVYENRWAAPFASALRRTGGQLVASGRIAIQDLLAALDEAEQSD
jgi:uncharacterized membrane protein